MIHKFEIKDAKTIVAVQLLSNFLKNEFESYLLIECHLSRLTVSAYLSDINYFINQSNTQVPTKAGIIIFFE